MSSSNFDSQIKEFTWIPNPAASTGGEYYVFLNLPVVHFNDMTKPSGGLPRYEAMMKFLANHNEVWMPIIGYRIAHASDSVNSVYFEQGTHTTAVSEMFSDEQSRIIVMAPNRWLKEIIEDLQCRIVEVVPFNYEDYETAFLVLNPLTSKF